MAKNLKNKIKWSVLVFIICFVYWCIDSFISLITHEYNLRSLMFHSPTSYYDPFILIIPPYQFISRILVIFMIILTSFLIWKYTKTIRDSERKLKSMFNAAPIGIGLIDPKRNIVQVNSFFEQLLGYQEFELKGKNARIMYETVEEYERVGREKHPIVKQYGKGSVETKFLTKDKRIIDVLLSSATIEESDNLIFTSLDITNQKNIQRELKTSAQIFEAIPSGVLIYDCSGINGEDQSKNIVLVEGNPAAEYLAKIKLVDVLGKTFLELWPNATDLADNLVHKCVKGKSSFETDEYHYEDNNLRGVFRIKSFCIPNHRIAVVFEDVTEQVKANSKIKESELLFRTAFETIPDAVAINRRLDGTYVHVNQGYLNMSGYSWEELSARTSIDVGLWANQYERDKLVELLVDGDGKTSDFELEFRRKDGSVRQGLMSAALIKLEDEWCTLTITKDITNRKEKAQELLEKEKQIRRAAKMEAVGTLAGGVAHDFNNIVQIISGNVQLLMMNADNDDIKQKLSVIYDATQRGSDLSRRLLTFSRNVESKLQPTDVNAEIKLAHKLLDRSISGPVMINIKLQLSEDLDLATADPTQLNQIITNLCINAKDAMPGGGHVIITTRNIDLDDVYCETYHEVNPGRYVRITVADSGEGMTKEVQERIFEPFFTTKEPGKGTGLGLAVVYGIVKNHYGHITVYSAPGKGTEFKVYLPANGHENVTRECKPIEAPLVGGNETILIIDDEDAIITIGREILTKYGYDVITRHNGEQGLKTYQERYDKIDLVILDLIMPGLSGTEVLKEIMKLNPKAKVIVASGYSANGPIKDAIGEGAKRFIDKPYTLRQLINCVREVIDNEGEIQ